MANNRKLTAAQKFRRRLIALQKRQSSTDGVFFEHDNRSSSLHPKPQSEVKKSLSVVVKKTTHKKTRSREYWNRIKVIKKQQLAMQRLIVGAVCSQNTQAGSCCCHCACPSNFHDFKQKLFGKNGGTITKCIKLNCGSSELNIQELKIEESSRQKMHSVLRYLNIQAN